MEQRWNSVDNPSIRNAGEKYSQIRATPLAPREDFTLTAVGNHIYALGGCYLDQVRSDRDGRRRRTARADGAGSGGIGGRAEEAAGAAAAAAAAAAERDGDVSARVQVERDDAELKSHDT